MSHPLLALGHLDGTRFCMVCMDVLDAATETVKLTPIHGVAKILPDRLVVEEPSGNQMVIPDSALVSVLPSDGTAMLKDAEYYVIVKMGAPS